MKLKIINLNVWFGGQLWDSMVAFLKSEQPDILFLQEVQQSNNLSYGPQFNTLEMLTPEINLPHVAFGATMRRLSDNKSTLVESPLWGTAILSKFPLTQKDLIFYDLPYNPAWTGGDPEHTVPRALQYATCSVDSKTLHLFNNHGIWGHNGGDTPRRLNMSKIIIEAVRGKSPAILAGDFNTNERTQSINQIGEVLSDVFKNERATSFNVSRKPVDSGYKNAVVDFLFLSKDIKVISHHSPPVDVSDHLPLICEIEI